MPCPNPFLSPPILASPSRSPAQDEGKDRRITIKKEIKLTERKLGGEVIEEE